MVIVQPLVVLQDRRLHLRAFPGQTNTPTQLNTSQPDPAEGLSTLGSEGISPDGTLPGPVARSKPLRLSTTPSPDTTVAGKPIESRLRKPRVQAPTSSKPRSVGPANSPLKPVTQLTTHQRTTTQQEIPQIKPTRINNPQRKPWQTQPAPLTSAQLKPPSPAPAQVFNTHASAPKPSAKPISTPTPTPFQARTDTITTQVKPNAVGIVGPVGPTSGAPAGRVFNSSPTPQAHVRSAQPLPAMSKPTFAPSRGAPAITTPPNQIVGPVVGPVVAQPAPAPSKPPTGK